MIYELFKPNIAGWDIYNSLTSLFNCMKDELLVPDFLQLMSITSIYKNRGSKSEISSERGVFNLSKIRSVLDKLLYKDKYELIDSNLSCSNVGGRKQRNIRDHLFVLYSIINDVKNGRAAAIDIQGVDISKCFDEMGFQETHNDLWDVSLKNDKFALVAKLDENCQVRVKTPCGPTQRFNLENTILQGSVFAPIKCCIQIDSLGRDCYTTDEGLGLYKYKETVFVPPFLWWMIFYPLVNVD